jgi:FixJ family two-component response regulator
MTLADRSQPVADGAGETAAYDAGADGFLAKPVRVKPLLDDVRRELERATPAA